MLAPIQGQHTKMHGRAASDGTDAVPMLRPVRPVRVTGQTGSSNECSPRRDPSGQAHVGLL